MAVGFYQGVIELPVAPIHRQVSQTNRSRMYGRVLPNFLHRKDKEYHLGQVNSNAQKFTPTLTQANHLISGS